MAFEPHFQLVSMVVSSIFLRWIFLGLRQVLYRLQRQAFICSFCRLACPCRYLFLAPYAFFGTGVSGLVVSPLLPVELTVGNDLLPPLPPYRTGRTCLGKSRAHRRTIAATPITTLDGGYVELRPARALDFEPDAIFSLS